MFDIAIREDAISSVKDIDISDQPLNIFPNPSKGTIYIKSEDWMEAGILFSVMDAHGRLLHSGERQLEESMVVDLENLPDGIYFIVIQSGELRTAQNVIISR